VKLREALLTVWERDVAKKGEDKGKRLGYRSVIYDNIIIFYTFEKRGRNIYI
jgi:hypothetical protein